MRLKFLKDFEVPGIGAVKALAVIEVADDDADAATWIKDGVCEKAVDPKPDPAPVDQKAIDAAVKAAVEPLTKQFAEVTAELKTLRQAAARRPVVTVGEKTIDKDEWRGFKDAGDFALAVKRAGHRADQRLDACKAALGTYANEDSDADGGFMVPPAMSAQMFAVMKASGFSIADRCAKFPVSGNSMSFITDENTPWGTSAGITAAYVGEGSAATQSKPKLGSVSLRLKKLVALAPLTDELAADAAAMGTYLTNQGAIRLMHVANNAYINGTGVGQPLGLLNAPATKSVAKKSGQTAATLVLENVLKMYSAMPADSRANAVWHINQDVEPQLFGMAFDEGASAGKVPIYMPPNGVADRPFGTLLGAPVIPVPYCQTLGTVGDILFVDWSQYIVIEKASGIATETSIHFWFDQSATAFRMTYRHDGQPWMKATISAQNGSATYSPYVSLATRA